MGTIARRVAQLCTQVTTRYVTISALLRRFQFGAAANRWNPTHLNVFAPFACSKDSRRDRVFLRTGGFTASRFHTLLRLPDACRAAHDDDASHTSGTPSL